MSDRVTATMRLMGLGLALEATACSERDPVATTIGVPTAIAIEAAGTVLDHHGDSTRVVAVVRDQFGRPMANRAITWASSDTQTLVVRGSGWVVSGEAGKSVVTATHADLAAIKEFEVKLQANVACAVPGVPVRQVVAAMPDYLPGTVAGPGLTYSSALVTALDFEMDGDDDVLVFAFNAPWAQLPQGGRIHAWRNDGTGVFTDASGEVLGATPLVADHTRDVIVDRLNGDPRPDVFAGQHGWDTPPYPGAPNILLLSHSTGLVESPEAFNPRKAGAFTHSVAGGDIDCDGDVDLFESNLLSPSTLYQNDGTGRFQAVSDRFPFAIGPPRTYTTAEFCDIDRDGDADLVLGDWNGSATLGRDDAVLLNNGFGRFRRAPRDVLPAPRYSEVSLTVELKCVDQDLDGWNDLVVSQTRDYTSGGWLLLWRNTGGRFTDVTSQAIPVQPSPVTHWVPVIRITDLNGDGWQDLVIPVDLPKCRTTLLINRGDGAFADGSATFPEQCGVDAHGVYDVLPLRGDRDGITDLLVVYGWFQHNPVNRTPAVLVKGKSR